MARTSVVRVKAAQMEEAPMSHPAAREVLMWEFQGGEWSKYHPNILRTNKKIHDEAAAALYGEENLEDLCAKLVLNDLQHLHVDLEVWCPACEVQERFLERLKTIRANKFSANEDVSEGYEAELKAAIEGPKDAVFFAFRQQKEDDAESGFESWGDEKIAVIHQWVKWRMGQKDGEQTEVPILHFWNPERGCFDQFTTFVCPQ
ncbi:hypothetical protein OEA41_009907 [Lepraria neglecta]|uniref:Uncharacterized protein n=1 Tax=Lepraria neglecta TaxID=209136 RepID=A0AAE0DDB9_9LECA|nr:hypothetical protein OEA41_009907 [Lepraria neglecta]